MANATAQVAPRRAGSHKIRRGEGVAGWMFVLPVLVILGIFLVIPVFMALWVSLADWTGNGSPFSAGVHFIGLHNFSTVLSGGTLMEDQFGISLKNNLWYVVFVVPLQTALSLSLALLVNRTLVHGKGFFRTAYYFPSVTSSVAITVLWLFLFSTSGTVNRILSFFGIQGPNWFNEPSGVIQDFLSLVGVRSAPRFLAQGQFLGVSWWDWLGGPSVAMSAYILMAIFTTSGTFMLLFLAALQNLSIEVDEAAMVDGASSWRRFWRITLPQLRPTMFTVLTLGMIGCWQVFDQIYAGTQGAPANTTLTPAYLSYSAAFGQSQAWGQGAAISFILFAIIVLFTIAQRLILRDRKVSRRRLRAYSATAASGRSRGQTYRHGSVKR